MERRGGHIGQLFDLRQKSGCGLHRMMRRGVAAGEYRATKMSHALEAFADASTKDLAAPDRAVVAVARAIEADADNAFVPFSALGEHGGDMCAVVLTLRVSSEASADACVVDAYCGWQSCTTSSSIPANLVHRNQIVDRLLKRLERFEMFEVANVLADERLPVNDQGDRVLQIGADREDGSLGSEAPRLRRARIRERDEGPLGRKRRRERPNRPLAARSAARRSRKHRRCRQALSSASSSSKAIGSLERFALVITRISGAPAANSK